MNNIPVEAPGFPIRYGVPTSAIVVSVLPIALLSISWLLNRSPGVWYPALLLAIAVTGVLVRRRQGLVLHTDGAHITIFRTHDVPWSAIQRFELARRGGVLVVTEQRSYRSVTPSTGMVGRASAEQVAELERIRRAHQS